MCWSQGLHTSFGDSPWEVTTSDYATLLATRGTHEVYYCRTFELLVSLLATRVHTKCTYSDSPQYCKAFEIT